MNITVDGDDGVPIEFEAADTLTSGWVCTEILQGKTYPFLPFVDDVQVVFDVGANCGATSVYFSRHYSGAVVHAFEPGSDALAVLRRNLARVPNARVHAFGLHASDQLVPFYKGDGDSILGSVIKRSVNLEETETVQLRAAGPWAREQGIDRIDILKVDVEGCEAEVLESLRDLLPTVKVLYLEYDSRAARRRIRDLVDTTHELYTGMLFLDQGECIYLRKDLASLDVATERLRELLAATVAAAN